MIVSNLISAQVGETNIDDDVGGSWRWMAEEEVSRDIFDDFSVVNLACIDYEGRF